MNRADFHKLTEIRIKEAKVLLDANELYTHDLTALVNKAKLTDELQERINRVVQFKSNWAAVKDWKEIKRYEYPIDSKRAKDLYRAITTSRNGVLSWLKKYW